MKILINLSIRINKGNNKSRKPIEPLFVTITGKVIGLFYILVSYLDEKKSNIAKLNERCIRYTF